MDDTFRNEIIATCLERKSLTVDKNGVDKKLLENDHFVYNADLATFQINLDSQKNRSSILAIAEEKLGKTVPLSTSEALKFVYEFEDVLKKPETNVSWAGLYEIRHALAGFVLAKIHNEGHENVIEFVRARLQKKHKDEPHLRNIESYFFEALLNFNMDGKEFMGPIRFYSSSVPKTNISNWAITFARKFGQMSPLLAKELYNEIVSSPNWEKEFEVLPAFILVGLYEPEPIYAFRKAKEQLVINPVHALFFFGRIDFSARNDLEDVIEIIKKVEIKDKQTVNQLVYLLTSILKSKFANEKIVDFCFQQFQALFDSEILDNKLSVIEFVAHWVKDHEKERYDFLLQNHGEFGDFDLIENYFSDFKDSIFFFHFFQKIYHALDGNMKPGLFHSAVNHFWRSDPDKTERFILDFLAHEELFWRKAGMHLIKARDIGVHQINLLRLDTEIEQLRALEILTEFNWNLEAYLPMILLLRNSRFTSVRKELQRVLAKLTFESYHDILVEKISNLISNSVDDKKFIRPIKEALEKYNKLVEVKSAINDLNPLENERSFMNLYYRLEHENQAIIMEEIKSGRGSFLGHMKNSIIVRGHSWKLEGQDQVVPLAKMEHSFSIDARAYKNNELFEHQTNNFKSKY